MRIDQDVTIPSPIEEVWGLVTDLPRVSRCVPGVEDVTQLDDDSVAGTLRVRVGPIGLRLQGTVRLASRDGDAHAAELRVMADDRRLGAGVLATTSMRLTSIDAASTRMEVGTEATLKGPLGQFGQPIIRRKSDEIAREFTRNVAAALRTEDR
jgi:carbon monoxide dehydrogenase subunit G